MGDVNALTDPVWCDQAVLSGIAVNLQDAVEALQFPFSMLPAPTWGMVKTTPGGTAPPHGRSSRASAQKNPVLVFLAPKSRTKARVSSMNRLGGPLQISDQRIVDGEELEGGTKQCCFPSFSYQGSDR
jgi:hypothetical protein